MLSRALVLAVAALSTLSAAQNYSTSGPLTIDLTQINDTTLTTWCASQRGVCPLICGGQGAFPNQCNPPNVLDYQCNCTDGSKPNISDFAGTIPSFICQQWQANCILSNQQDQNIQQDVCLAVKCGSKDAQENVANTTSTTSAAASGTTPTSSAGSASTPASSETTAPTQTPGAAAALLVGQSYGTGLLATGLLGLFAFLL